MNNENKNKEIFNSLLVRSQVFKKVSTTTLASGSTIYQVIDAAARPVVSLGRHLRHFFLGSRAIK